MKVTVKQADLAHYISYIGRIVDSKPSLPVLGNILVEAQKDHLTLTATNLEVSMQVTVPAEITERSYYSPRKDFCRVCRSITG